MRIPATPFRFIARAAVALLAALPVGSCDKQPATPSSTPRLAVLSPALAVTLTDLGGQRLIVGRHAYDLALDPAVPVCGDQSGIDYEALLTANPTDVLLEWGTRPLPDRLVTLADQHRWTLKNFTLLTLDDIRSGTRTLHDTYTRALPGTTDAQRTLDRVNTAFLQRPTDLRRAGTVLLLLSATPPAALGPGSFHHQILEAIGAQPALTTGSPYIELDAEDIQRLRPDAIVFIIPRAPGTPHTATPTGPALHALLGPLTKLDLPCVKLGRVAVLDDPYALLPSTAMARFADDLADQLQAWARPPNADPK